MADVAFIATHSPATLNVEAVVLAAAEMGLEWRALPQESPDGPQSFGTDKATIIVMAVEAMHPDIPTMPVGPTAADPEELSTTQGHLIVTAVGLTGDTVIRDSDLASCTTVVMAGTDPAGAMLGHNAYFHRTDVFHQLVVTSAAEDRPALPILISITVAGDGSGRMSFLSHGMHRYDKEDLYVTCSVEGTGAVPFVYDTLTWFFDLEVPLPTGDRIGRDESEQIEIQRVPNPADPDRVVVRLDLD